MAINLEARKWWTNPSAALRYIVAVVAVALEVVLAKEIENWRAPPFIALFLCVIVFWASTGEIFWSEETFRIFQYAAESKP